MSAKVLGFTGRVGGVTYTDPALFETAAKALGFRGAGVRVSDWKVGTPVRIRFEDGTEVAGQVWSRSDIRDWVWVALDNGTYVAVATRSGIARKRPGGYEHDNEVLGRVA